MKLNSCLIFILLISQYFCITLENDISEEFELQTKKIEENRLKCQTNNSRSIPHVNTNGLQKCPKTFDLILCWDETLAGEWALQPCPVWFIGFENSKQFAKRFCQENGTWVTTSKNTTYTDYTLCIEEDTDSKILPRHLQRLKTIAKIGSLISLGSLIIAMILLIGFKRLHCARNILHCNLFGSFLLFSITHLIKETFWVNSIGFPKDLIMEKDSKLAFNPNVTHWECKTLMTFFRYAESSNHVMIFAEALYLNTLVSVSTFSESNHFKLYITLGWVGPLVWIVPYVIIMSLLENNNSCWNTESGFSYLYVVPQVLLIFLNFGLFINIVRILKNKLRKNRLTDSKQYRFKKLAKSTLILLPLFSIYYIAFSVWQPFVRGKLPLELELIRLYFEIICSSFQGLAISLIYGFFNSEVRNEVINQIERKLIQRYPNMRRFSTMVAKERNSCVSMGHDRNRSGSRISEKKIKKMAKSHSPKNDLVEEGEINGVKDELGTDNNNNNIDIKNNIDNHQPKKVLLKEEKSDNKKSFNIFKKRKKESNSTITSGFSSKGSKGTIRLDSIDANSENFNRGNSSFKLKNIEFSDTKTNPKVSFAKLNENSHYADEQLNLLENKLGSDENSKK